MVGVDRASEDESPKGHPEKTNEKHAFVAEDIAEATGWQDEGSHCERVACDQPWQFCVREAKFITDLVHNCLDVSKAGLCTKSAKRLISLVDATYASRAVRYIR